MLRKKYDMSYSLRKRSIREQIQKKSFPVGKEKFVMLKELCCSSIEGATVLDIGCGEGSLSIQVACEGANVITIDISREALALVVQNASSFKVSSRIDVIVADGQNLPIKDKAVDVIVLSDVLEHVGDPKNLLKEANRVLVSVGGMFLILPNAFGFYVLIFDLMDNILSKLAQKLPQHIHHFTKAKIVHLLGLSGFKVVHCETFKISQLVLLHKEFRMPKIVHLYLAPWRKIFCDEWALWVTKKSNIMRYAIACSEKY